MDYYGIKPSNSIPEAVIYGSYSNKKMLRSHFETDIVFERAILKTGLMAITLPTIKGANDTLDALNKLIEDELIAPIDMIVVENDKHGRVNVKKVINRIDNVSKYCELSFVVGLLLRGSVAIDLLGAAAGTLLAHGIDLGIAQEKIDRMIEDMVAGNSVVFVKDFPNMKGMLPTVFSQTNGRRYDLSMTDEVVQKVKIMSSTLNYYWN